jgi:hypothetical protein
VQPEARAANGEQRLPVARPSESTAAAMAEGRRP